MNESKNRKFVVEQELEDQGEEVFDFEGDRDGTLPPSGVDEESLARAEFIARYLALREFGVQVWFVRGLLGELEREWKYRFSCEGGERP